MKEIASLDGYIGHQTDLVIPMARVGDYERGRSCD
jgi:hypothetical protein